MLMKVVREEEKRNKGMCKSFQILISALGRDQAELVGREKRS